MAPLSLSAHLGVGEGHHALPHLEPGRPRAAAQSRHYARALEARHRGEGGGGKAGVYAHQAKGDNERGGRGGGGGG